MKIISKKQFKNISIEHLLILVLLLFFGTEAYNKLSWFSSWEKNDLQKILKAVVFISLGVGLLFRNYKVLLSLLALCLIFIIGQWQLAEGLSEENLIYLSKFLFPILLFSFFNEVRLRSSKSLFNVYEFLVLFNSLLIILGFIFDIIYFKTYSGKRFGYSGLMITSATATYFYCIAIFYFFIRYKTIQNWKFLGCVLAAILVGTKSIYLFLALFGAFYIIRYVRSKKLKFIFLFLVSVLAVLLGIYLLYYNPVFSEIRSSQGIISAILSYRDQLFIERTLPFIEQNWSFTNYLFGGASDFETRPQLEFFDLFYFWGIIGSVIYLLLYYHSFKPLKLPKQEEWFFFISLIIIMFLAGNFFYNASIPIYLLIFKQYPSYPNEDRYEDF
ncbi:MAG TPA: hypothetical protein VK021_00625 [Flavobacteriaceae bacterium]|nr:hypothetical protein [Flavobacteriaceae bacterium]